MLYGITASEAETASSGVWSPNNAVTFNDAELTLASLACTDNAFFSMAGWFNADWDYSGGGFVFIIDPDTYTGSWFQGNVDASATFNATKPDGLQYTGGIIAAPPLSAGWQHIIWSVQTSPSRVVKCYVDDVDVGASLSIFGPTFTPIASNGKKISIGTFSTAFYGGDMMDLSIWPGTSFLTAGDISEATRRLFVDGTGAPVDPATAIASLGAPPVMLSGNASTFRLNTLGTAGAFMIGQGSLSNAATHP